MPTPFFLEACSVLGQPIAYSSATVFKTTHVQECIIINTVVRHRGAPHFEWAPLLAAVKLVSHWLSLIAGVDIRVSISL